MALTDILVHIDVSAASTTRVAAALALGAAHGARVTGLFVVTHQHYQSSHGKSAQLIAEARQQFTEAAQAVGVESRWVCADWSVVGVSSAEIISHHAHYTDLLVIGQGGGAASGAKGQFELPERLILSSGRPVLVVPATSTITTIGKKVLIAWKAGREATRAVNDALPILAKSDRVTLLAINSSAVYDDDDTLCSDISDHLGRHGIRGVVERVSAQQSSVGDALLNRTFEEGYDLLVMGAFAHTPQGTLLLGDAARQMLQQSTVPILFSH
jgi:nucleotide-binding universal stress UspA family protein